MTGLTTTAGLVVGATISDSSGAVRSGTTVASVSGTTLTLSQNASANANTDTLYTSAGTIAAYSQQPWPPGSGTNNCWIWFATGDEVDGPLFTNDTIRISGTPAFYGSVYSAAAGRVDEGTGSAEIPCVTDTNNDECNSPPSYRGDEPQPTTSAEAAASKQVGCYITGGTSGGASSAPADVTMALAVSGTSTKVTWTGAGWTYVNNAGTNTNVCGSSGNTGSNGGSFVVSSLASGLIYVNGNVNISGGGTAAGFLTVVAGDDSDAGPTEWSSITGNLTSGSATVTNLSSTSGLSAGEPIVDYQGDIPNPANDSSVTAGTTIVSVNTGAKTMVLSQKATSSNNGDLLGAPSAGDIFLNGSITYPSADLMGTPAHCPASWSGCPQYDTVDALGLVANYFIQLPSSPTSGSCGDITVDAAMLALTDSVYVQDWAQGQQCYLDVFGAIAQNFRARSAPSGAPTRVTRSNMSMTTPSPTCGRRTSCPPPVRPGPRPATPRASPAAPTAPC